MISCGKISGGIITNIQLGNDILIGMDRSQKVWGILLTVGMCVLLQSHIFEVCLVENLGALNGVGVPLVSVHLHQISVGFDWESIYCELHTTATMM